MLASGGDDKQLMMCVLSRYACSVLPVPCRWDTREADRSKPAQQVEGHSDGILAVAFSPASEHLILTGSHDKARPTARYPQHR